MGKCRKQKREQIQKYVMRETATITKMNAADRHSPPPPHFNTHLHGHNAHGYEAVLLR
jgi:hypothetical protein